MRFVRSLIFVIFISALTLPLEVFAARQRACLKNATGEVLIKRRCRAPKFTELNAEALQNLGAAGIETLSGPTGPQGIQGVQGPQGEKGESGAQGPSGIVGYEVITSVNSSFSFPNGSYAAITAACPAGKVVVGGSCDMNSTAAHLYSSRSTGINGIGSWNCNWRNASGLNLTSVSMTVKAFCIAN